MSEQQQTYPSTSRLPGQPRPLLGVSLGPHTMHEALELVAEARRAADIIEFRLDLFREPYNLRSLLAARGTLPVVITLRPRDQGGQSDLLPAERLSHLQAAASLGAEYVDVEWDAVTPAAIESLRASGSQVIVSRHDFGGMPPAFASWVPDLFDRGADIVKVVATPREAADCVPVFRALRQADRPIIALGMGLYGMCTRLLVAREPHCFLSYGSLSEAETVAPGQISVSDMEGLYRFRDASHSTSAYGLIAPHPDKKAADIYNTLLAAKGLDAMAVPVPIPRGDNPGRVLQAFEELPMDGWHVHGEALQAAAVSAVRMADSAARSRGRVNAIRRESEGLRGTWVESPEEQLAFWTEGRSRGGVRVRARA